MASSVQADGAAGRTARGKAARSPAEDQADRQDTIRVAGKHVTDGRTGVLKGRQRTGCPNADAFLTTQRKRHNFSAGNLDMGRPCKFWGRPGAFGLAACPLHRTQPIDTPRVTSRHGDRPACYGRGTGGQNGVETPVVNHPVVYSSFHIPPCLTAVKQRPNRAQTVPKQAPSMAQALGLLPNRPRLGLPLACSFPVPFRIHVPLAPSLPALYPWPGALAGLPVPLAPSVPGARPIAWLPPASNVVALFTRLGGLDERRGASMRPGCTCLARLWRLFAGCLADRPLSPIEYCPRRQFRKFYLFAA